MKHFKAYFILMLINFNITNNANFKFIHFYIFKFSSSKLCKSYSVFYRTSYKKHINIKEEIITFCIWEDFCNNIYFVNL